MLFLLFFHSAVATETDPNATGTTPIFLQLGRSYHHHLHHTSAAGVLQPSKFAARHFKREGGAPPGPSLPPPPPTKGPTPEEEAEESELIQQAFEKAHGKGAMCVTADGTTTSTFDSTTALASGNSGIVWKVVTGPGSKLNGRELVLKYFRPPYRKLRERGYMLSKTTAIEKYQREWRREEENNMHLGKLAELPHGRHIATWHPPLMVASTQKDGCSTPEKTESCSIFSRVKLGLMLFDFVGAPLKAWEARLPGVDLQSILCQGITALAALEQVAMTHADLSPNNIALTENGHLSFFDFGISALSTDFKFLEATPGYVPPEFDFCYMKSFSFFKQFSEQFPAFDPKEIEGDPPWLPCVKAAMPLPHSTTDSAYDVYEFAAAVVWVITRKKISSKGMSFGDASKETRATLRGPPFNLGVQDAAKYRCSRQGLCIAAFPSGNSKGNIQQVIGTAQGFQSWLEANKDEAMPMPLFGAGGEFGVQLLREMLQIDPFDRPQPSVLLERAADANFCRKTTPQPAGLEKAMPRQLEALARRRRAQAALLHLGRGQRDLAAHRRGAAVDFAAHAGE